MKRLKYSDRKITSAKLRPRVFISKSLWLRRRMRTRRLTSTSTSSLTSVTEWHSCSLTMTKSVTDSCTLEWSVKKAIFNSLIIRCTRRSIVLKIPALIRPAWVTTSFRTSTIWKRWSITIRLTRITSWHFAMTEQISCSTSRIPGRRKSTSSSWKITIQKKLKLPNSSQRKSLQIKCN